MDRKQYQKEYYLKKKTVKSRPLLLELVGCLITYFLSIIISIYAFQQFSTFSTSVESWLFFFSTECLILFLSLNLSKQVGVTKIVRLTTVLILTLGLNYMISKGAYDNMIDKKRKISSVEKDSTMLRESIKLLDNSIKGYQQREMHTKAVEIINKKEVLLRRLDKITTNVDRSGDPNNQLVIIIMRFFISVLNISVINRIGQILSHFIS